MIKLKELFETEAAYSGSSFHFLEPTKIPPSKKDVLKGGEEEEQEELEEKKDKIQVQGLGVYTPKTLKDKVTRMSIDLAKVAKRGDWNKSSRNAIRALGEMWGALSEYEREN